MAAEVDTLAANYLKNHPFQGKLSAGGTLSESFSVVPLAHVVGGRAEPTDDFWGGTRAVIRLDPERFTPEATLGMDKFSHLEILFRFHLTDPNDLHLGARRPRDNPAWPEVGTFGHRNMRRINWLGVSRCRLLKVDGLDLHV
jgi:tRNA (Thr-GGU) A37 N-methylase